MYIVTDDCGIAQAICPDRQLAERSLGELRSRPHNQLKPKLTGMIVFVPNWLAQEFLLQEQKREWAQAHS